MTLQNRRKKIEVVRSEIMPERRVHNGYVSENARVLHGYTRELEIKGKRNIALQRVRQLMCSFANYWETKRELKKSQQRGDEEINLHFRSTAEGNIRGVLGLNTTTGERRGILPQSVGVGYQCGDGVSPPCLNEWRYLSQPK